jgi:hypothetical protein
MIFFLCNNNHLTKEIYCYWCFISTCHLLLDRASLDEHNCICFVRCRRELYATTYSFGFVTLSSDDIFLSQHDLYSSSNWKTGWEGSTTIPDLLSVLANLWKLPTQISLPQLENLSTLTRLRLIFMSAQREAPIDTPMFNFFWEHERNIGSNILFVDAKIGTTPCDIEFYLPLLFWQQLVLARWEDRRKMAVWIDHWTTPNGVYIVHESPNPRLDNDNNTLNTPSNARHMQLHCIWKRENTKH